MNKRAASVIMACTMLGVGAGVPGIGAPPRRRERETIDDVLARARRNKERAAFDLSLDGRKQGLTEVEELVERFGKGTP